MTSSLNLEFSIENFEYWHGNETHFPQVTVEISPPSCPLASDVHEHFRGDPEEDEELTLECGQFGIEPLDDATCLG